MECHCDTLHINIMKLLHRQAQTWRHKPNYRASLLFRQTIDGFNYVDINLHVDSSFTYLNLLLALCTKMKVVTVEKSCSAVQHPSSRQAVWCGELGQALVYTAQNSGLLLWARALSVIVTNKNNMKCHCFYIYIKCHCCWLEKLMRKINRLQQKPQIQWRIQNRNSIKGSTKYLELSSSGSWMETRGQEISGWTLTIHGPFRL